MKLNSISNEYNASKKRVGRGGDRGKTSGKGHKGQKARAGSNGRVEMRDFIKKLPKRRGFGINRSRTVVGDRVRSIPVNIGLLNLAFQKGEEVTPLTIAEKGIISKREAVKNGVKILAHGELTIALTVVGCEMSASAKEAIEKAGGTVK